MHRVPRPQDPRFETLLEDRDHLKIQIHLAGETKKFDEATLNELRDELRELEHKIDTYWRSVSRT